MSRIAIVDFRASQKSVDALLNRHFTVVKTPRLTNVYTTICGHTDIMLYKFDDNTVICEPSCADYFKAQLPGVTVLTGRALRNKYPDDIAYNAARVGNMLICAEKYTDRTILQWFRDRAFKIINTKQGYAKCSVCIVADGAIITSDENIRRAAASNGIDVLKVCDKKILLNGFEHGFIGGATGMLDKHTLAVNGNIMKHHDADKIIDFCNKYNVDVLSLHDGDIEDIGSIVVI